MGKYVDVYKDISEGQISVKLIVLKDDGVETWLDLDLDTITQIPPSTKIAVFDSTKGTYSCTGSITEAKEWLAAHYARLRIIDYDARRAYIAKKIGKAIHSTPITIPVRKAKND